MDMYDLPSSPLEVKDKRPSPYRVALPVKLEAYNGCLAQHLHLNVFRHDMQIWGAARLLAGCLENRSEASLDLRPPIEPADSCCFGDVGVEDCHIVRERGPECIPVEIIERDDEPVERLIHVAARVAGARDRIQCKKKRSEDDKR